MPFDPIEGRVLGKGEPITPKGVDALYPDVPPHGAQLIYRTIRRGKHELRRRSLITGEDRMLPVKGDIFVPRWSDDGTLLAFRKLMPAPVDGTARKNAIVIVSADGTDERNLTTPSDRERTPPYDWSADGRWILGSCEHGPAERLAVCVLPTAAAPRAEEQIRIVASDPDRNLYQATFSPNQQWIAFIATSPGLSAIYVVSGDGGQWTAATEGTYWDDKPRWSPDGKTCTSCRTGQAS